MHVDDRDAKPAHHRRGHLVAGGGGWTRTPRRVRVQGERQGDRPPARRPLRPLRLPQGRGSRAARRGTRGPASGGAPQGRPGRRARSRTRTTSRRHRADPPELRPDHRQRRPISFGPLCGPRAYGYSGTPCNRRHRPREELRRRAGGRWRGPRRAERLRLRSARPERRRQDHHDPHARHAAHARRGLGPRARPRRGHRGRRRALAHEPHGSDGVGRRGPHRPREPRSCSVVCSGSGAPTPRRAPASCSRRSVSRTRLLGS